MASQRDEGHFEMAKKKSLESCGRGLETNHSAMPGKITTHRCQGVWQQ